MKINRFVLWTIFGLAWIIPQGIILFLPEKVHFIEIPLLIFFVFLIAFWEGLDKLLIEKRK